MVPDVLIFAHRSGMAGLFPGFDRRLVNALLMCDESPCVIAPASPAPSPSGALSFWRLIQAITGRRRVTLIAEGQRCERLAPCRLLIHQQASVSGGRARRTYRRIHPRMKSIWFNPCRSLFAATTVCAVWLKTRCLFRPYPIFALSSSRCLRLFRPTAHRNSAGLSQLIRRESLCHLLPLSPLLSSSSF